MLGTGAACGGVAGLGVGTTGAKIGAFVTTLLLLLFGAVVVLVVGRVSKT